MLVIFALRLAKFFLSSSFGIVMYNLLDALQSLKYEFTQLTVSVNHSLLFYFKLCEFSLLRNRFTLQPRLVISMTSVTRTSLCSLLLMLETPNAVQTVV